MRTLYHFPTSPFSRRTRLALAHKGIGVTLKDARANAAYLEEARAITALRTVPVLVEEDGRAVGDSAAISFYLDRAYPATRPLWPSEGDAHAAFTVSTYVDCALNTLVDVGTRYFDLRDSPGWGKVSLEMVGRAQHALDALGDIAEELGTSTVTGLGWCAPDIWLFTATEWLEGLPARRASNPNVAKICSLGWTLPASMSRWADTCRRREDVKALQ